MGKKAGNFRKIIFSMYCEYFSFFWVAGCSVTDLGWGEEAGTGFYGPGKGRHTRGTTGND